MILSAKRVKTRKPHTCWGCARPFPAGTEMEVLTSTDDGLSSDYWCEPCQAYWKTMEAQGYWDKANHRWTNAGWREMLK